MKRKTTKFFCFNCGKESEKALSELIRNEQLKRKNFCSRKCSGQNNLKNFGDKRNIGFSKNPKKRDDFTPFRIHLRRAKKRFKEVDITLEYLKEIWDKQNGICPYTNIKLVMPLNKQKNNVFYTASLDRIDSSKGYIKGNIQFISTAINYMKAEATHEQTIEFINLIKDKTLTINVLGAIPY